MFLSFTILLCVSRDYVMLSCDKEKYPYFISVRWGSGNCRIFLDQIINQSYLNGTEDFEALDGHVILGTIDI